jgi:hypothetical protein
MDSQSKIFAIGLAALAAACSSGQRLPPVAMANCAGLPASQTAAELYSPEKISRVEPIIRTQLIARATKRRYVIGADLYLPAEPGLNEAYLERALSCRATSAAGSGHPNDPLLAADVVDVDVTSVGPNMRVAIVGADREAGEAILQRARALRAGSADVTIQQLSSASPVRPAL